MTSPPPTEPTAHCIQRLQEILADELDICEGLVAEVQEAHRAFSEVDPGALRATQRRRRQAMERLETLEGEASALRAKIASPPQALRPHIARLQRLAREIAAQEAALSQLSASSLARIRHQVKGCQTGAKGLRGYRGSATVEPRFSDRRG